METIKINNDVMPAQAGIRRFLRQPPAFAGVTMLLFLLISLTTQVLAADEPEPVTYSPDFCEFSITFPEQPYTSQRCDENDDSKCYDMVSYTQVYDMTATVNFRTLCSPIDQAIHDNYSAQVMEATLRAMTDKTVIKTFDTSYREDEEGYKQAGLVGEGQSGRQATIYIAQLWIGKQSAFSLEVEMIGDQSQKADALFSEVLKSVHYSGVKKTPEEKKAAKEAKKKRKEAEAEKAEIEEKETEEKKESAEKSEE